MGLFGIKTNKINTKASLGNISTQAYNNIETMSDLDESEIDSSTINKDLDVKKFDKNIQTQKNTLFRPSRSGRRNSSFKRSITNTFVGSYWAWPKVKRKKRKPIKYSQPKTIKFVPVAKQDTLNLTDFTIKNDLFDMIDKSGISTFRPEIISLMDFKPLFSKSDINLSDLSSTTNENLEFINFQIQSAYLRENILKNLIEEMSESPDTKNDLTKLTETFNTEINQLKKILIFYSDLIAKLNIVKNSLDIKYINPIEFGNKNITIEQFFEKYMQFSSDEYKTFTETKIYNQLITDLRSTLENYSYSLLNIVDQDRINNFDPVKIDKTFNLTNGFSFKPASLTSLQNPVNASNNTFFINFLNSLPNIADDRIKLLCNFLSKELRVSKALGNKSIQSDLLSNFEQGSENNPFDNIFGEVGDTIFEKPLGSKSLSSLSYLTTDTAETVILPFENIYVDSNKDLKTKTFVPGTNYFVDSILTTNNKNFNIKPFTDYSDEFSKRVSSTSNILNKMFELDIKTSKLTQATVFDTFMIDFKQSINNLTDINKISKEQAIINAIFKLANQDLELKNCLFDFCLLLGLASSSKQNQKKIFSRLKSDIPTINSLNSFKSKTDLIETREGYSYLKPFIDELAQKIETIIFTKLNFPTSNENISSNNNLRFLFNSNPFKNIDGRNLFFSTGIRQNSNSNNLITLKNNINTPEGYLLNITFGDIKNILINTITTNNGSLSNTLKDFIDVAVKLNAASSIGDNEVYLMEDETFRTRNNRVSTSCILLVVFEIFSSIVSKYSSCEFSKASDASKAYVKINTFEIKSIIDFIDSISQTKTSNLNANQFSVTEAILNKIKTNTSLKLKDKIMIFDNNLNFVEAKGIRGIRKTLQKTLISPVVATGNPIVPIHQANLGITLKNIRDKLDLEDIYIIDSINIFNTLNKRISSAKQQTISTFSKDKINTFVMQNKINPRDINSLTNISQLRTSTWILDKYLAYMIDSNSKINQNTIVDTLPEVIKNSMFLMFKQPKYLLDDEINKKTKLLTVGIPYGMTNKLSNRITREKINNSSFLEKEIDVIKVNVYKRDARYEDIVFKPINFYFDLSLYPSENSNFPNTEVNARWFTLTQNILLSDYDVPTNKINIGYNEVLNNSKYSFLTNEQKTQMVFNHFESLFLTLYIKYMTGFVFFEETFTQEPISLTTNYSQNFYNLLLTFLKKVKGKDVKDTTTIQDLLVSQDLDDETKDIVSLLNFGNIMFQSEAIKKKTLIKKLFDRVFTIPVTSGDFEIDYDKTVSTDSGKSSFVNAKTQDNIIIKDNKYYLIEDTKTSLIFDDYFITLENNVNG